VNALATQWFHDRKLIMPTFHINILDKYATTVSEKTEILINYLEEQIKKNSKDAIDIFPLITKFTVDVTYGNHLE